MDRFESLLTQCLTIDPNQPRKHYNEHSLNELAASLVQIGLIEPLVVRPTDMPDIYQIVSGHRRHRAALIGKIVELKCHIRDLTDDQVFEIQVHENLQREDISPLDECDAYHMLMSKKKQSIADMAFRYGKSEDYIFGRMRLSSLITSAKNYLHGGVLPVTAAIKLASLKEDQQKMALDRLIVISIVGGEQKPMFTGLRDMKVFFDNSILLPLAQADFDTKSVDLLPCGACTECPKRTGHNTLFKDIADDDKCMDASCYHDKHVRHYQQLAFKIGSASDGAQTAIFASRHYNSEKYFKELGTVLDMFSYEVITEAQAKIEEHSRYAVFVGIDSTDLEKRSTHGWIKLKGKVVQKINQTSVPASKQADDAKKKKVTPSEKYLRSELHSMYLKSESNLRDQMIIGIVEKMWGYVDLAAIPSDVLRSFLRRYELSFDVEVFDTVQNEWKKVVINEKYDHKEYDTPLSLKAEDFSEVVDSQLSAKKMQALLCELQFMSLISGPINQKFMKDELDIDVNVARQIALKTMTINGKAIKSNASKKKK